MKLFKVFEHIRKLRISLLLLLVGMTIAIPTRAQQIDLAKGIGQFNNSLETSRRELEQAQRQIESDLQSIDDVINFIITVEIISFLMLETFWLYMLILLIRSKPFPEKTTWIMAIVCLNILGAVLYLLIDKRPTRREKETAKQEIKPMTQPELLFAQQPKEHPDARYMPKQAGY
jgi:hypothetical protein